MRSEWETLTRSDVPRESSHASVRICDHVLREPLASIDVTQIPASHHDLLASDFATFATIGPDGRPQLSEVWFVADDASVVISLNSSRQKTKNLMARPACCLFILDLANPGRYLELRGDAEVTPDDGSVVKKVEEKYGADVRVHDGPGDQRVVVRLSITKVNAVNIAG